MNIYKTTVVHTVVVAAESEVEALDIVMKHTFADGVPNFIEDVQHIKSADEIPDGWAIENLALMRSKYDPRQKSIAEWLNND